MLQAARPVLARINAALPIKGFVANSDIVRSYLGVIAQVKSDFDAIQNFRSDTFFKQALDIGLLASSPSLRQRMDSRAVSAGINPPLFAGEAAFLVGIGRRRGPSWIRPAGRA